MQFTSLKAALQWATEALREANVHFGHGTNNAWDEAVALMLPILPLDPEVEAEVLERPLSKEEQEAFTKQVKLRISKRIPAPYLTHEAWFAGLKFYVDERVIIPRSPMGELILNRFQPWLGKRSVKNILDLCTGSGCIAIACAYAFEEAKIDAVDISKEALAVASKNVLLHNREEQIQLIESDLFSACQGKKYDLIITNPPYVDQEKIKGLPLEYQWEPSLALAAEHQGLAIVKRILEEALHYLNPFGLLFVEVGSGAEILQEQYPDIPFTWLEFERGGEGIFLLIKEEEPCWQTFY